MTSSTAGEIVNNLFAGFGQLLTDGLPFFYLFLGGVIGFFAIQSLTRYFVRGIKNIR